MENMVITYFRYRNTFSVITDKKNHRQTCLGSITLAGNTYGRIHAVL